MRPRLNRIVKGLAVVALAATTLLSVTSAGATSLSTVTFTGTAPTSLVANTASTWTVGLTTSSAGALALGGSIAVTFPSGFTTSSTAPVVTLLTPSTFLSSCTATGVDATKLNVVTINLTNKTGTCVLLALTGATLSIGVVNGSSGTYGPANFSVATSSDTTPISPSAGATITAKAVTAVSVTATAPTSLVKGAASTWTWGFTPTSTGSLAAGATIKLVYPLGFTTLTSAPVVVLKTPTTFPTLCTATAADPTLNGTMVITLANNGANICALAASTAATFSIGVVNGTTDVLTTLSLSTSKDATAVSPTGTAPVLTSASSPSAVSFTTTAPTSLVANADSTWTINFSTSSTGALATGGYVVATFPAGFKTASTTPAVTLTEPSTFPTNCTATGSDVDESNVVIITLANNGANTCALALSTAGAFNVAMVNGPAGTDAASSFTVYTSKDGTAAAASSGSTIVASGPPGTGSNWTLASPTPLGEATAAAAPAAPAAVQGGVTGGYLCASTASEVVALSWSAVAKATSYVILQSSTSGGSYLPATPAPVFSGTTATITYTTAVTEYFKVEAEVGTAWVSAMSGNATNGSVSPGYVVTALSTPFCTNN